MFGNANGNGLWKEGLWRESHRESEEFSFHTIYEFVA